MISIVVGESACELELRSAHVLAVGLRQCVGAQVAVTNRPSPGNEIWIGTPETHGGIEAMERDGVIEVPVAERDGYVIAPVREGRMVLAARSPHCLLYAVYDLLERRAGFGHFCDVDREGREKGFDLSSDGLRAESAFDLRVYLQPCVGGYSGAFWDLGEWERELDWAVKARFNAVQLPIGAPFIQHEAMRALEVETELPRRQRIHAELAPKIVSCAHDRGMRVMTPSFLAGSVCPEFRERYTDARTFEMRWFDYPPTAHLYPDDPMFEVVLDRVLQACRDAYGTDPLFAVDCYAEQEPPGTDAERLAYKRTFAAKVAEVVARQAPDAVWVMSGWSFVERKWWPLEHIRGMLAAVPGPSPLVVDYTANYTTSDGITKIHAETGGFYGKPWGWSVFHSFGGNTQLHGDVHALLSNAPEAKGPGCRSFHMVMEIVRHNAFYFDLAVRLGWDPSSVESLEAHIVDFARRRYGGESAGMIECWRELAGSLYRRYDMNDFHGPAYQFSPSSERRAAQDRRIETLPSLERAVRLALAEAESLGANPCFRRDLVDVAKEYYGNLATFAERRLWEAFEARDSARFEAQATELLTHIETVARWAECLPEYHMAEEIERAVVAPYFEDREEATREIRTRYSVLVDFEHYDTLLDYARRDMVELIREYYAPRRAVLVEYLRYRLAKGFAADDRELHDRCIPVARAFIEAPAWPPFVPPGREVFERMVVGCGA